MKHHMHFRTVTCLALTLACSLPLGLRADDVTDAIDEATQFYKDGNYAEAAASLDYATQLIRQKRSGDFAKILPKALDGWEAEESDGSAVSGLMGGMVTAERSYNKKAGDGEVRITIVGDSPVMQSYLMMFSNPIIASSSGGKLKTVNGQRALVRFKASDKSGEMIAVVGSKYLVTVHGDDVTQAELESYFKAIDFAEINKL